MATLAPNEQLPDRWQSQSDDGSDPYADGPRGGIDFRLILAVIRRRQWWIVGILALAAAAAVLVTSLQTPRYTAQASVQINDQSDRVLSEGEDTGQANNGYDTDRFLKTQVGVLQSRGLAVRVAQKLKLFGNARFYTAMTVEPPPPGLPQRQLRELTIGLLRGGLAVDLPYDSRIASLSFTSGDPAVAAEIANAFAAEMIQATLQRRYDSSAYARQFVSGQLGEAKTRLEASERAVNAYAREAGLIRTRDAPVGDEKGGTGSGGAGSVTTASLVQINSAANEARAARIAAEGRMQAVNSVPLLSSKEVLANSTVQSLLSQRAALQGRLEQERTEHLDDYPGIAELKAQIAEVNRQLTSVATSVRAALRNDYTAAQAAENALDAQVGTLKGATLAEQDKSVQYNLLAREADTNRELFDGLLQRYKELNAASGISTSNLAVIDEAEAPLSPSSPNLMRNIVLGLILGLLLAIAVVFLSFTIDDTIRVPEDVERKLGLALLGVVPRSEIDPDEALADPKSPMSEGYNALRASLLHATSGGLPPVMLVTSAQAAEGKTTTSEAIARTLARLGKRVLLVDGDLRRPSIHRRLAVSNERGLSTLLTSGDPLDSAVVASSEPGLDLLTSGPVPPSPTELTSSIRFRALIDEMADKYDAVIIDSPPILGLADAPAMSALVDGVILVIESERSRRGGLKAALRRLRAMRPMLLGAVLTKFDTSHAANRYSEYYGTQYYDYDKGQAQT